MNYKKLFILALSIPALLAVNALAQGQPPASPTAIRTVPTAPSGGLRSTTVKPAIRSEQLQSFKFEGADLDTVMTQYCEWTGQIYLKTDAVKASITLKADKLTTSEAIKVVEAILAMNNIALVPMGEKYIKVIQATAGDLTGQGLSINMDPEAVFNESDEFVTRIIPLKNVQIQEVQAAIQHVLHAYGKILTLQRSNSIMITDTAANIKRASELVEFIDQATAHIEPRIYQIKYAEATEIAAKINEIVTAAQGDEKKPVTPGNPYAKTPPGVIRATAGKAKTPTQATISKTEGSSTVIIQGTVKVMADERTNIIIIFSQEENFAFFDNIIKVLDVEVEPAINFEVINLEYADAEELSGTLNELVGAATGSRTSTTGSRSGSSPSSSSRSSTSRSSSSRTSSSRTSSSRGTSSPSSRMTPNAVATANALSNLNRLSENTKILADQRSNSILLMGEKSDIAAIKEVVKTLDVMLEQVVIEAAIFEIGLNDSLRHGIDWVYQAIDGNKVGAWDGSSLTGTNSGIGSVAAGALTYYQNLTGLNSQVLINLAATDANAHLVSTPVIMTTDNTEASLSIGEQRPVVTSTSSFANSSGTQSSQYEYKDIGIQLTVTPRINPQRFVVMELTQQADQLGGSVTIDNNEVPIILNREFEASVAVPDGGTVVLGGLVTTEKEDNVTKIPILGDIPLIGRYLFSSVFKSEVQRELIVLLTPYVVSDKTEMINQTERLYRGSGIKSSDWGKNNWSKSKLRQIPDPDSSESENEQEPPMNVQETSVPLAWKEVPTESSTATAAPASSSKDADEEEIRQLLQSMDK